MKARRIAPAARLRAVTPAAGSPFDRLPSPRDGGDRCGAFASRLRDRLGHEPPAGPTGERLGGPRRRRPVEVCRRPSDAPAFAGTPDAGSSFHRFRSHADRGDRFGSDRGGGSVEPPGGPR